MITAKDIFTDKQYEETFGTGDMIPAPIVTKQVGKVDKYKFEILLKEKFLFKPPMITTSCPFNNPSLADGRDLLMDILPHAGND